VGRERVIVFAVALLAYLPGFWWGSPHATATDRSNAWSVDDEPPLGPLAQLHDILNPKPTQNPNLGYPMLHPFLVIASYTPYVGFLYATGGLDRPTEAYPHGFRDPVTALRTLTWIAHLLSVLLGAGIVLAAYETARVLWDARSARFAAFFALMSYPMFYYARTSNVDVPVLFFTAIALVPFARALMLGVTMRRALWLGALIGLALATKEPSFASFMGVPFALLLMPAPDGTPPQWRAWAFWKPAIGCLVAAVAGYAVASGMIIDPDRWMAHIAFIRERSGDATKGAVAFMPHYPRTAEGHVALAARLWRYLADAMTLPGLVLALAGIGLAARARPRSAVFAVTAVTYLVVLFWSARAAQLRYVMPAAYTLALFAGYAAARAFAARQILWRSGGAGLVVASGLIATAWAIDLTHAMLNDSRYAAGDWLARTGRPGDRLEYFGSDQKEVPMEAWLTSSRAIRYLGGNVAPPIGAEAVAEIRAGWALRRPRFISLIPDYTSRPGEPNAASGPPAIFAALEDGSLGYALARTFRTPSLLPWAKRPALDYPTVNPPIRIYVPVGDAAAREPRGE